MLSAKVYSEDWEVNERLLPFKFSRSELLEVAQKTLAERSNTIDIDVASAQGQLAYIHGSRHLRLLAVSKNYKVSRDKNIESSICSDSGIMVAYQNVDVACANFRAPKAISGKKSGSAELIDRAQGCLFSSREIPETIDLKKVARLNSSLWYFCVSFDEDSFSAELSLPASIQGNNFSGFIERIFIAKGQQWFGKPVETTEGDYAELEPKITRK